MATPAELNDLSILDLVASDAAYKTIKQYNEIRAGGGPVYLQSFPDSAQGSEEGFPDSLRANLSNQGLTAYSQGTGDGLRGGGSAQTITFTNWVLIKKFQNDSDGFGAAVFKSTVQNDGKYQFIVAFQGSDGTDAQDWFANLDLARKVWKDRGPEVIDFLVNGGIGDDGVNYRLPGKQPSLGVINFTGQSLGGGLAQYGAYFYAKQLDAQGQALNLSQRMSLIEFNSFGAVAGIDDVANAAGGFDGLPPSRYDKNLLADVPTIHYAIDNDIVHRLGTGNLANLTFLGSSWHVNGSGNSYTFDFQRFNPDGIPLTGEQSKLNLVDAHRIESGFYRGFANYGSTFASAANLEHANYSYIDTDLIQNTGALLSRMFSDGTSSNLSAKARTVLAVLGVSAVGPISELQGLQNAIVGAIYDAGDINAAERAALSVGASPITIKAVLTQAAGTLSKALGAAGLLISFGMELFKFLSASDKQAIIQEENELLPADRQIQYQNVSDPQATSADWAARYETYSLFAAQYADPADRVGVLNTSARQRLADDLSGLDIDPAEFGAKVIDGDDWISDTAILVESTLVSSGATPEQWAKVNGDLIAFFAGEAQKVRVHDAATADRMEAALEQFTKDSIGRALANTKSDFSDKYILADASVFGATQFDFVAYDQYHDALEQAASNPGFSEIAPLIEEALAIVEAAGEVVDLEAECPAANPFDTQGFDPDAAPPPSEQAQEGGVKRFTLSLPYEAGEGGKRIAVTLDGTAAPNVKLLSFGEEVVAQDGVYTVVVEEGHRELELAVWGQIDVTENGTLAVSATLVNAAGQATHQTHTEANVEFVARNDRVFDGTPDFASDSDLTVLIQSAIFPRERGVYIDFLGGNDTVWGDAGEDRLLGGSGNDRLFGSFRVYAGVNDRDWLSGGPGDDQLLGGEGDDILEGDSGSDLLLGDVGDDFLFGGSKADYATIFTVGGFDPEGNTLQGGAGKDLVAGSGGADALSGGNDADLVFGGAGNDMIRGDTEFFPTHTFQIIGSTFPPTQPFAGGPDVLYGNAGSDTLYGEAGDDLFYGGEGDDTLIGGEGRDTLYGGAGNDFLVGDSDDLALALPGGDFLDGGEGDDRLSGQGGADTLTGGRGNDVLDGGAGNDTYIFSSGDGQDIISDRGITGSDVLIVNNYAQGEMTIRQLANGSVRLTGANGDEITISRRVGDTTPGIELVQFADGTNLSIAEIAAQPIAEDSIGGDGWTTLSDQDDTVYTFEIPINDPGGFVMVDTGDGNDTVFGGPNAVLFGNDGDDTLLGGVTLLGGRGNDYLSGAVTLIGGPGDDELRDGEVLFGGPGNDFLDGGFGPDRYLLRVEELGQDTIADSHGLTLEQFAGWYYHSINIPDWEEGLFMPERDDSVRVEEGIALGLLPPLPKIAAHDWSALAPLYATGVIEADVVEFGEGLTAADLSMSWGETLLTSPVSGALESYTTLDVSWGFGNAAKIVIPHAEDPLGTGVEEVRFADGSVLSMQDMVAVAPPAPSFDPQDQDNVLEGSARYEVFAAGAGNDTIFARGGNDVLDGGQGSDILRGGEGADNLADWQGNNFLEGGAGDDNLYADGAPNFVYGGSNFVVGGPGNDFVGSYAMGNVIGFNAGDGQDTVYVASALTLSLGGGVDPATMSLSQDGSDLVLAIGASDSIRLTCQFEPDPQAWPVFTLQMFGSVHLYDFNAVIVEFQAALAADPSLVELTLDNVLQAHETSVSTTEAFGGALAYQYGTTGNLNALSNAAIGKVLGDANFGTAPQSIEFGGANQAATLDNPIADQTAQEDAAFSFTVPANTFSDIDLGDMLRYSATRADGSALPAWLTFNAATRTFGGTPANEDVGAVGVEVTATDGAGASVSDVFDLTVANTHDTPVLDQPIADQSASAGVAFDSTLATDAFRDIDQGDALGYRATEENGDWLPARLSFDAASRHFSGTPAATDVGANSIRVSASDLAGTSATDDFRLVVSNGGSCHEVNLGGMDHYDDRGHDHGKRDGDRLDPNGERMVDCLAAYVESKPGSDFEALGQELERPDRHGEALNSQEIARRWQVVGRYASELANEHDEDARGGADYRLNEHGLLGGGSFGDGFGYSGSIGAPHRIATLQTLQGLEEGFQRLHNR